MSFYILYVEDNPKDFKKLSKAVVEQNRKDREESLLSEQIHLSWARNLDELKMKLEHKIDIVLADMLFGPEEENLLQQIIDTVRDWCLRNDAGRPIPIIAYTIDGFDAFRFKKDLYDIWDKNTASQEYVAWRLSKLSVEISRMRPDALIQRKIRTEIKKEHTVSWHSDVLDMIKRYDEGWTENDQIDQAGKAIENIAHVLNTWDYIYPMWEVIKKWEFYGRAVSQRARGHARHAINVFWLGYYLIHNEHLRECFNSKWDDLIAHEERLETVRNERPLEAINCIWFYTALFHDMAGCMEKFASISNFHKELYSPFKGLGLNIPTLSDFSIEQEVHKQVNALLSDFLPPLQKQLKDAWEESLNKDKADHGMLAALSLRQKIKNQKQNCYSREAGRAIAIHNLIGRIKSEKVENLTWEKEPFACLLLLCDQLQTWDRERGETKLRHNDGPERAELGELEIDMSGEKPHLKIAIDYIAPPHLKHAPGIYGIVKDDLNFILRNKPRRALNKIDGEWPFLLDVNFSLSKEPLNAFIKIPHERE